MSGVVVVHEVDGKLTALVAVVDHEGKYQATDHTEDAKKTEHDEWEAVI